MKCHIPVSLQCGFPQCYTAPEQDQLLLNPLQYSLSLANSGTKRLREQPRAHTEECVSNLRRELLSPNKPLWISAQWFVSNLFSAAQQLLEGFGLSPPRHLGCDQHCCCNPSTFTTPRRSRAGGRAGEEDDEWDTTRLGLLSAPSWLVIFQQGQPCSPLLSLACQHELTFELC